MPRFAAKRGQSLQCGYSGLRGQPLTGASVCIYRNCCCFSSRKECMLVRRWCQDAGDRGIVTCCMALSDTYICGFNDSNMAALWIPCTPNRHPQPTLPTDTPNRHLSWCLGFCAPRAPIPLVLRNEWHMLCHHTRTHRVSDQPVPTCQGKGVISAAIGDDGEGTPLGCHPTSCHPTGVSPHWGVTLPYVTPLGCHPTFCPRSPAWRARLQVAKYTNGPLACHQKERAAGGSPPRA